ncbi:MAG: transposase [Caldilineaceae bacterium]
MTYKYRLFPTSAQRTKLESVLEICRWVYNDTLGIRKDTYEQTGKGLSFYDTCKLLTEWKASKPALKEVHSQVLQNVQERVDLAYQAFFRRVKLGEEPGFPRFKGKGVYDSFTFKQSGFKLDGEKLFISKVGDISIKLHRPICADIKTLTIQRDAVGNFYACFSCECEAIPLEPVGKVVGVDLGLTTFAYCSDGEKIERQRWMKQDASDIARLQRKKEQFLKGSPERRKVIRALNHAYARATNRRRYFAHQASRKLVNEYQFIAFEKLDIQGMQSNGNKRINRGIADVAWGQFVQCTIYKAANAGRVVVQVDPKHTTQMCSGCHAIVPKDLSVRIHDCPHCGLKLNRDHNAAMNILARGLAGLSTGSPVVAIEAHG